MTYRKSQKTYTKLYWLFTALMLLTAMPLGLVLILVKLFERRKKPLAKITFHPVLGAPFGAQTTLRYSPSHVQESVAEAAKKMSRRAKNGLRLVLVSGLLLAVCAMNSINLWTPCCCLFVSLFYMCTGLQTLVSVSRFQEYAAAMDAQPVIPLGTLAAKTGRSEKQIRTDMERLEFMELIPGAFLDRDRALLFCF